MVFQQQNKMEFYNPQNKMEFYNPPYCIVNDEAYDRMMATLQSGERYVKSYLTTCPHKQRDECKCIFYLNFLDNGDMIRSMNGELKIVINVSRFKKMLE